MKIQFNLNFKKADIYYLIQAIITWTFINFAFNMFGLYLTKILNQSAYEYPESVWYEFVKPILLQSLLFGIIFSIGYIVLKRKVLAYYMFSIVQFVIFHLIFFLNLNFRNGVHFVSTFKNIGIEYLTLSGQYFVDILYLYFPVNGNYTNGIFAPDHVEAFYIHWILLNIVYYFFISWISLYVTRFFFGKTTQKVE